MTDALAHAEAQESLEGVLKNEILRMYQEIADNPAGEFHFHHGREGAELFGYQPDWLDRAPEGAVDLGSGAGLDAIIAGWHVGPTGRVIGVDLNPSMCLKAQAHAAASGTAMECQKGQMEDSPLPDASVDVVISNGVINLSFRKRRVVRELYRVTRPGGRISAVAFTATKPERS